MRGTASRAETILEVAERLARSEGYNGFSFRQIAAEVGVKSASVHYHFPTKADLGVAVARRYADRFMAALGDPEDSTHSAAGLLARYVDEYRQALLDDGLMCLCGLLAAEVASLPEAVAAEARGFFERNVAWLARVLARSHRDFSHDPEKRRRQALAILAALQGAMLVARSLEGVATFDDIVGELGR